ncbi:uncharacterized protein LOC119655194 isoform X2 [Hermetia illucens]|nr:uncharacterized protein LOC119655194 isoform X2 [Hermetia illucens]
MFFCGTYFAFTLVSIFSMAMICFHIDVHLIIQAAVNGIAAACFIIGSIVSMYHAENDFHLMYLSDVEESEHEFFVICKTQSIVSLITGLAFMLHATFTVDAIVVHPTESQLNLLQVSPADRAASGPLELVLFCKPWFKWMNCNKKKQADTDA